MKITAIGRSRQVHTHTILDRELKQSRRWDKQTWDIDKHTGNITFSWIKWSLNMSGDYQFNAELSREEIVRLVSAELSREEIVRLFVSSMSDVPFEEVVRVLTESGKKPTIRGRPARSATPAARSRLPSPEAA
jgi:hypothetical protein